MKRALDAGFMKNGRTVNVRGPTHDSLATLSDQPPILVHDLLLVFTSII